MCEFAVTREKKNDVLYFSVRRFFFYEKKKAKSRTQKQKQRKQETRVISLATVLYNCERGLFVLWIV